MLDLFFFSAFTLLTLGGGLVMITRRNAVHAAIALIVSLLGVAGLFLSLAAEFIFAAQLVLYIGGVMTLFLFTVMMVDLQHVEQVRQYTRWWPLSLAVVLAVGGVAVALLWRGIPALTRAAEVARPAYRDETQALSDMLLREYLAPFEAVSLLLLVALAGSVFLARRPS